MSFKVFVDAGHGSITPGNRTPVIDRDVDVNSNGMMDVHEPRAGERYKEHYANVMVCYYLDRALRRCGIETVKSGWNDANPADDADTAIAVRQEACRNAKCDLSISNHFNAYGDGDTWNRASGVGVFIHSSNPGKSEEFAGIILKWLMKDNQQKNRGYKRMELGLCNTEAMGVPVAVLIENAFMANENEAYNMMMQEEYCREQAEKQAQAVCEYLGIAYKNDEAADDNVSVNGILRVVYEGEDGLTLRNEPSFASGVSRVVYQGEVLGVTGKTEDFYYLASGEYVTASSTYVEFIPVNAIVKVDTDVLNIRKGPGTEYQKNGQITDEGSYTVTKVSSGIGSNNGWGKLKSGAGWISLDYVR